MRYVRRDEEVDVLGQGEPQKKREGRSFAPPAPKAAARHGRGLACPATLPLFVCCIQAQRKEQGNTMHHVAWILSGSPAARLRPTPPRHNTYGLPFLRERRRPERSKDSTQAIHPFFLFQLRPQSDGLSSTSRVSRDLLTTGTDSKPFAFAHLIHLKRPPGTIISLSPFQHHHHHHHYHHYHQQLVGPDHLVIALSDCPSPSARTSKAIPTVPLPQGFTAGLKRMCCLSLSLSSFFALSNSLRCEAVHIRPAVKYSH